MDRVWDGADLMSALLNFLIGSVSTAGGGGVTYDLVDESAEGTGTPSGWTNGGSPNWDYTTTILQGTHSVLCGSGATSYYTFASQSTAYGYCLFRIPTSLPGSVTTYCGFRASDTSARASVRVNASGQVTIFANGSDSTACVATMSANTTYHVWWSYTASGTCTVAFSTDGVRPTSGDNFTSKTGGAGTCERYVINPIAIYDRMLASTSQIGNSP